MSGTSTPDLSIIVASYNVAPLLAECLRSLPAALAGLTGEIWVVDNDSRDGSADMVRSEFPQVHLIQNSVNRGFAKANNQALAEARGRYFLLLNPDTYVPAGTLLPMVEYMDQNPTVGMAGPRLMRPDGRLDEACRRSFPTPLSALSRFLGLDRMFPKSRFFGSYRKTFLDPQQCYEVDSVVGAFMLLRRQAMEDVGGLDEDYFMFGEDLDWCYRLRSNRWKVVYLGSFCAIHHKGASSAGAPYRMNYHFHRSMVLFHRKHLINNYPFFVNWAVYGGISLRYAIKSASMMVRGRPRLQDPVPRALPRGLEPPPAQGAERSAEK